MMTLELDDETAALLNQLVEQEHISPAQLVKNVLLEHLEDCQEAKKADDAKRDLQKLDNRLQKRITFFLLDRLQTTDNPRLTGKALQGKFSGL